MTTDDDKDFYKRMVADLKDYRPEVLEYKWFQEYGRVIGNYVPHNWREGPAPAVPVYKVLTVLEDCMSYPEIVEAFSSAPPDGQIPDRERELLHWFGEYIKNKYQINFGVIIDPMRELANKTYKGLNDPIFRDYLISLHEISDG
jgi:hypothetical protein